MKIDLPLAHRHIIVTRPLHQAQKMAQGLRTLGAIPLLFPTLEIQPIEDLTPLATVATQLDQWNYIIFTSVNAVEYSLKILSDAICPPSLKIIAVGNGTANALKHYGWMPELVPAYHSSEGILASELLQQVTDQRILLIGGQGGRSYLQTQLIQRGAQVKKIVVYQRQCPQVAIEPLIHLWQTVGIDCIMITSGEGFKNLIELLGQRYAHFWQNTLMCVISERVAELSKSHGLHKLAVASTATDQGMIDALLQWYKSNEKNND